MKRKEISRNLILAVVAGLIHELMAGRGVVVENYGLSFGLGKMPVVIMGLITMVVLGLKVPVLVKIGALGNLVDRLRWGFVRDYWLVPGLAVYNNVYDWMIFIGLVLVLFDNGKNKNSIRR